MMSKLCSDVDFLSGSASNILFTSSNTSSIEASAEIYRRKQKRGIRSSIYTTNGRAVLWKVCIKMSLRRVVRNGRHLKSISCRRRKCDKHVMLVIKVFQQILICNNAGFLLDSRKTSMRIWSSQNIHSETKQALIFSRIKEKNLHDYIAFLKIKTLLTWETSLMLERTPHHFPALGRTVRTPSKDKFFWQEFSNEMQVSLCFLPF